MTAAMAQRWSLGLSPKTMGRLLMAYLLLNGLRLGLWLLPFAQLHRWAERLGNRAAHRAAPPDPCLAPCLAPSLAQPVTVAAPAVNPEPGGAGPATAVQATAALVQLVARHSPGQTKCLALALTTQVLLRRRGYQPQLHIGVAWGEGDRLQAHAWVELSGAIVIGQVEDLARYRPLPSIDEVLS